MAQETIFSKIIRREIPADIVYQDELVTAFRDINPQAPTHILIVPNKLIPTVNDVTRRGRAGAGPPVHRGDRIVAEQEGIAAERLPPAGQLQPRRRAGGLSPAHAPLWRPPARPHAQKRG